MQNIYFCYSKYHALFSKYYYRRNMANIPCISLGCSSALTLQWYQPVVAAHLSLAKGACLCSMQVVLLLHDMADVFLYLSKTLHYSRIQSGAVEISFTIFVIVFFITRLVIFPVYCVRPTLNTTLIRALTQDFVESRWRIPGGTILPSFLVVLQVCLVILYMHIFPPHFLCALVRKHPACLCGASF